MKVLCLMSGTTTTIGGIESLMPHIIRNLLEMGVDMHLIAQFIPPVYSDEIFYGKIHEVTIPGFESGIYMKLPRILRYFPFFGYCYKIMRNIKKINPDVIHCHGTILSIYALIIKKLYHIPYVTTFHSSLLLENYLPFAYMGSIMQRMWKNNPIFRAANHLTAVSLSLQKETEELTNCPVIMVPNAVDTTYFSLGLKEHYFNKKPILVTVSRLSPVKSLHDVICAMSYILPSNPDCKLVIVGDGEQRNELEEYAASINLGESIEFVGAVPNSETKKYFQNAKIYLMPSESEGFPISLLEALSSGLPFIATPVSIVPEICDGNNGVIVPYHNPMKIAEAVNSLLSLSDEEIYSIAQTNHAIASRYSWKKTCE